MRVMARRKTKEDIFKELQAWAKKHRGECLATEPVGSQESVNFKCHNPDHPIFSGSHDNMIRKDQSFCPYCPGMKKGSRRKQAPKAIEKQIRETAKERGYEVLSTVFEKTGTSVQYELNCKHHGPFKVYFYKFIHEGAGCQKCTQGFGERLCREYFEKCFEQEFPLHKKVELAQEPKGLSFRA
jgi:hypothetical protein